MVLLSSALEGSERCGCGRWVSAAWWNCHQTFPLARVRRLHKWHKLSFNLIVFPFIAKCHYYLSQDVTTQLFHLKAIISHTPQQNLSSIANLFAMVGIMTVILLFWHVTRQKGALTTTPFSVIKCHKMSRWPASIRGRGSRGLATPF